MSSSVRSIAKEVSVGAAAATENAPPPSTITSTFPGSKLFLRKLNVAGAAMVPDSATILSFHFIIKLLVTPGVTLKYIKPT